MRRMSLCTKGESRYFFIDERRMRRKLRTFGIILAMGLYGLSCMPDRDDRDLRLALATAGDNRTELQKVLDHYSSPGDSLKLEAAEFLISNMRYGYYFSGEQLEVYDQVFPHFDTIRNSDGVLSVMEKFAEKHGPLTLASLDLMEDQRMISAGYLIRNIDQAFEAWNSYPWARGVPFELFKTAVLPYRVDSEIPEDWRTMYRQHLSWITDSLSDPSDRKEVFALVNRNFIDPFKIVASWGYPLTPRHSLLLRYRVGTCWEEANTMIGAMRALGIPAVRDFVPSFANLRYGHTWAALVDDDGSTYWIYRDDELYPRNDNPVPASYSRWEPKDRMAYRGIWKVDTLRYVPKIYRQHQSVSPDPVIQEIQNYPDELVDFFRSRRLEDVTSVYLPNASDLSLELPNAPPDIDLCYLAIFRRDTIPFQPIAVSTLRSGIADFANLGQNVVYFPVGSQNGKFIPLAPPFILMDGERRDFVPDLDSRVHVTLYRKNNLFARIVRHAARMVGGYFEVANVPDFSDARVIHRVGDVAPLYMTEVPLQLAHDFRYARYVAPENTDGDVAEIEFWSEAGLLRGKLIGSPGRVGNELENIADGDWDSHFKMDDEGNYWVGFDFGRPVNISKLRYCPRNDTNMIMPGNRYELFYWDWGWKSLGQQVATETKLEYRDVPADALFWLHNLSGGNEENVFTFEDGIQVFF
jgi:hypothetical protein